MFQFTIFVINFSFQRAQFPCDPIPSIELQSEIIDSADNVRIVGPRTEMNLCETKLLSTHWSRRSRS